MVYQSDASLTGFGVKVAQWPLAEVRRAGRVSERSRFRRVGPHTARESALIAAGLECDGQGRWYTMEAPEEKEVMDDWEVDETFEEIPAAGLKESLWRTVLSGAWKYEEEILELEGRALVKGMQRLACQPAGHHHRQLLLADNMSVVLAFSRGRSKNFNLLVHIRRLYAYCLAKGLKPYFRWIPSELNSSDEPFRRWEKEGSHLLTHLLEGQEFGSLPRLS